MIACCILTYNHPKVIKQIFDIIPDTYHQHGIDLLVYDSSDDEETKNIVQEYIDLGAENIKYIPSHQFTGGDAKMLGILKGFGLDEKYDYVWPIRDRTFFANAFWDKLDRAIDTNPDVICIYSDDDKHDIPIVKTSDVYTDAVKLFNDIGTLTTSWEGVIYNKRRMLDDFEWEKYEVEYELNDSNRFIQPVFLFLRLSQLGQIRVNTIPVDINSRFYSKLAYSEWGNSIFSIWGENWPRAIRNLPDVYNDYKAGVIKSQTMNQALFGSVDMMLRLEAKGILNSDTFISYRNEWDDLSDIPIDWIDCIIFHKHDELFVKWVNAINCAFDSEEYSRATWLFEANQWTEVALGEKVFQSLRFAFMLYKYQMNNNTGNNIWQGVHSLEQALEIALQVEK